MKKKYGEEFYLKRFQEVVAFLTAVGIKKHFRSIDAYKRAANSSRAFHLTIKWDILEKLTTLRINNTLRKRFEDFIGRSKDLFTYHRHCHKTYSSSDKHFSRNAFFELSDKVLEDYFSTPDNFNTKTCHFLSKEAHRFIDKHVYKDKFKKNQEENTTKAEKENENLKAENEQLRDPNSDIPKEEEKKEEIENQKKPAITTPPDDIPEEDDEDDIADKLDEIKDQKKSPVKPPEDDIPAAPEEKHYSKVIPRLQEFVNKCYISKREAERFAAIAKEKIPINESRTGYSYQDRQKNKKARETIIQVFVSEYQSMMDAKDWKWAKMFTI